MRTVASLTNQAAAIASHPWPSISAREHLRFSRRQRFEGCQFVALPGAPGSQVGEQRMPLRLRHDGLSGGDVQHGVDEPLVGRAFRKDPDRPLFEAAGEPWPIGAAADHQHPGVPIAQRRDQAEPVADGAPEIEVEQHDAGAGVIEGLQHALRGVEVSDRHREAFRHERKRQALGEELMVLDDEDAAPLGGCDGGRRRKDSQRTNFRRGDGGRARA